MRALSSAGEFFWTWIKRDQVFLWVLETCHGLRGLHRTAVTLPVDQGRGVGSSYFAPAVFRAKESKVVGRQTSVCFLWLCLNSIHPSRSWSNLCFLRLFFFVCFFCFPQATLVSLYLSFFWTTCVSTIIGSITPSQEQNGKSCGAPPK